jgi:UDP-N-acetylmuramyl pentapeptide phosphotransferase/UDP-N-acetylglucosamine-1-phosphate transferase
MKKFIGQCMVAAILAFKGKVLITSMHGFLGLEQLDASASYLLTFFTMIVVINAFNLIDGIDGLAGSVGLITSAVFATYFFINGDIAHALLGFALAGSIAAFLIYNYQPAKIFMGDTGSMLLGVVNAILVIQFIEKGPTFTQYAIHCSPAIGFGILLMPLMDTLRVFGIRIFNRRSPFSPDRNHLHHILLDRGMSHRAIAISIALASVGFILLSFFMQPFGTTAMIFTLVGLFFAGILGLNATRPRAQMRVVKNGETNATEIIAERKPVKLVSLFVKEDRAAVVDED